MDLSGGPASPVDDSREVLTDGSVLLGLFSNLGPPTTLAAALADVIAAMRNGTLPGGDLVQLMDKINIVVSIAENEKAGNHPAMRNMSAAEVAAVMLYTMPFMPDTASLYHMLNRCLRTNERQAIMCFRRYIWILMHALRRAPRCTEHTVFRGIVGDYTKDYKSRQTITWQSFSSCTTRMSTLDSAQFFGLSGPRVLFNIALTTNRARYISALSFYPKEYEVLLPPNTRFIVESVIGPSGDGRLDVQLKEIPPIDEILAF